MGVNLSAAPSNSDVKVLGEGTADANAVGVVNIGSFTFDSDGIGDNLLIISVIGIRVSGSDNEDFYISASNSGTEIGHGAMSSGSKIMNVYAYKALTSTQIGCLKITSAGLTNLNNQAIDCSGSQTVYINANSGGAGTVFRVRWTAYLVKQNAI